MPIIMLHGISADVDNGALHKLADKLLPEVVAGITELGLTQHDVTVFAPSDLLCAGPELVAFIEGLFVKDERTPEVRQRLADAVKEELHTFVGKHMPNCRLIEVIPRSQRPDDGFAQWRA